MPVRSRRPQLGVFLALVTAMVGLAVMGFVRTGSFSRSDFQLMAVPVVVLLFARCAIAGVRVPRAVLLCTIGGALCGALAVSVGASFRDGRFLITSLSSDLLASDAHVTRDQMQRLIPPEEGELLVVSSRRVESVEDAARLLKGDSRAGGVIWGSKRWTQISLRNYPARSLGEVLPEIDRANISPRLQKFVDLKLSIGIPLVGLSGVKGDGTLLFVGSLAAVWRDFPTALATYGTSPLFESRVRSLGNIQAPWTSAAHRAVPAWIEGTYYGVQALRGVYSGVYEAGEFACAKLALKRALMLLRPGDNPLLEGAILNNLGVIQLVEAQSSAQPRKDREEALRWLRQASRVVTARGKGLVVGSVVQESTARQNIALIVGSQKGSGKQRATNQGLR